VAPFALALTAGRGRSSVPTASLASREAARQYLAVSSGRGCFGAPVFRPESGWLAAPAPVQHCAQAACASI
jgi:hypothetical protein